MPSDNRWILKIDNHGRGRNSGYPLPPAQIRAGAIDTHGSYVGRLAAKRKFGIRVQDADFTWIDLPCLPNARLKPAAHC